MEKKKNKQKRLKIIGICLIVLIILFIILILIGKTVNDSVPEPTGVLSLEEIAEKEGRNADDFVPVPTDVFSLEDIVGEGNGDFEQNSKPIAPEPTNVSPLEE